MELWHLTTTLGLTKIVKLLGFFLNVILLCDVFLS